MSAVIQLEDFEGGFYRIPTGVNQDGDLQEVIDLVENEYLPQLFGVELAVLFLADLDISGLPQTARFQDVYDRFNIQVENCLPGGTAIHQSNGMVDLLKGIVYFLYGRDTMTRLTDNGPKITRSENAETPSNQKHDIYTRYNRSVQYWEAIQYRMETETPDLYPEFEGLKIDYAIRY